MTSTTLPHSTTSIIQRRASPKCRRDARNAFMWLPKCLLIHRPSTNLYSQYRKLPIKSLQFVGYAKQLKFPPRRLWFPCSAQCHPYPARQSSSLAAVTLSSLEIRKKGGIIWESASCLDWLSPYGVRKIVWKWLISLSFLYAVSERISARLIL